MWLAWSMWWDSDSCGLWKLLVCECTFMLFPFFSYLLKLGLEIRVRESKYRVLLVNVVRHSHFELGVFGGLVSAET